MRLESIDVGRLKAGNKREWDAFVVAASPLIHAMVRRVMGAHGEVLLDDVLDASQDVFVRLSTEEFRLLRSFDPTRSSLATWIAIVARSAAVDFLRRRRRGTVRLEDIPENAVAADDPQSEQLRIPADLLTGRQALVLRLLYGRDLDVIDVARLLRVDAQTVRSTHHKALGRLRVFFGVGNRGGR